MTSWKATATEKIAAFESSVKRTNEELASKQKDLAELNRSSTKRITELEGSLSIGEDDLVDKKKKLGNYPPTRSTPFSPQYTLMTYITSITVCWSPPVIYT